MFLFRLCGRFSKGELEFYMVLVLLVVFYPCSRMEKGCEGHSLDVLCGVYVPSFLLFYHYLLHTAAFAVFASAVYRSFRVDGLSGLGIVLAFMFSRRDDAPFFFQRSIE